MVPDVVPVLTVALVLSALAELQEVLPAAVSVHQQVCAADPALHHPRRRRGRALPAEALRRPAVSPAVFSLSETALEMAWRVGVGQFHMGVVMSLMVLDRRGQWLCWPIRS